MIRVLSLSVILLVLGPSPVVADDRFEGKWVNVDERPRGITRLEISKKAKAWAIQTWGAARPTESDLGKVTLHLLGDSVDDMQMKYGFASWDRKFADTYMTLRLDKGELVVESCTVFKDGPGRSNYRKVERFKASK